MSLRVDDAGNTIPEVDVLTLLSMDHERARACLATLVVTPARARAARP